MYESPPQSFEEVFAPYSAGVRAIGEWARELIRTEFPQTDESIHGGAKIGMALYSVDRPERVALGLQPGERFVKLFIHDPEHLPGDTSFELEGSGKRMRHVKLASIPEDRRDELLALMRVPVERRS